MEMAFQIEDRDQPFEALRSARATAEGKKELVGLADGRA
jgi:hypothetical protein